METLQQALTEANSPNNEIRIPAQQRLTQWEREHFGHFLIGLCQILQDTNIDGDVRTVAGLQIKNLVAGGRSVETQNVMTKRYLDLPPETRVALRNAVVPVLGSDIRGARKSAAQIVAKIASIEIPNGMWDDLVPMLGEVCSESSPDMKESALLTLSYVGEELEGNEDVMTKYAGTILNAVRSGITDKENLSVQLAASYAMLHCLAYVQENMKMQKQRKVILEMIFICCTSEGVDEITVNIRVVGFQCFSLLATLYYEYLPDAMELCAHVTIQAIQGNEHEEVKKQAIEFWSSVFEEEIDINKSNTEAQQLGMTASRTNRQWAQMAVESLCPILLELLKLTNMNVEDDDWNVQKHAAACLGLLARCVENDILQCSMKFIEDNLMSENWNEKDAATTCIGIMLQGPDPEVTKDIVKQIWSTLLQALCNENDCIRNSTAWTIGRIFQFCSVALEPEVLQNVVEVFCICLTQVHAKVAETVCWAISRLAELPERNQPSTPLSTFVVPLLRSLLECSSRPDVSSHNLLPVSFEAIACLVKTSGDDMIPILADELLPQMVQELQNLVENAQDSSVILKTREMIAAVTAIVRRVKRLSQPMADTLMNIYHGTLSHHFTSGVHEEAMAAIGDVASVIGSRFCMYLTPAANMICIGLNEGHKHPKLCLVAILVLGDIANACKEKLVDYCDDFLILLLRNLANEELDFDLKPTVVETIGDLALAVGIKFHKYVQSVMRYLLEAGISNPGENPSQDTMIGFNKLRQAVLDCLLYILHALESQSASAHIITHFGDILSMIVQMNSLYPSKKVIYFSLCTIEKMITMCPQEALEHLFNNQQFMESFLIETSSSSTDTDTVSTSKRIQKAVEKIVSRCS